MKTSDKILDYVHQHGKTSPRSLVDYLDISDRAIRKQLKALLEGGKLKKSGVPPHVYYEPAGETAILSNLENVADKKTRQLIAKEFLYISPRGAFLEGMQGFEHWCHERGLSIERTAARYKLTWTKYKAYKKEGLINGMYKMRGSFDEVFLDRVFYLDFYSIEIFGKTKLGQLLLFAKQSQNRKLMNELADTVKPAIINVINKYDIDVIGFIPPTVKRELQLMKQLQNKLNLPARLLTIRKIKTEVAVPQKTLTKIEDRVVNARETIAVDDEGSYKNILLIDDALGSGATLNETARKIRQRGICHGKIIGLAITGSFKGFEVISEV